MWKSETQLQLLYRSCSTSAVAYGSGSGIYLRFVDSRNLQLNSSIESPQTSLNHTLLNNLLHCILENTHETYEFYILVDSDEIKVEDDFDISSYHDQTVVVKFKKKENFATTNSIAFNMNDLKIKVPQNILDIQDMIDAKYDKIWFYSKALKSHLEYAVYKMTNIEPEFHEYAKTASLSYDVQSLLKNLQEAQKYIHEHSIPKNSNGKFRHVPTSTQQEGMTMMNNSVNDIIYDALRKIGGYTSLYNYLHKVPVCIELAAGTIPSKTQYNFYHAEIHFENDIDKLLDYIEDFDIETFEKQTELYDYEDSAKRVKREVSETHQDAQEHSSNEEGSFENPITLE